MTTPISNPTSQALPPGLTGDLGLPTLSNLYIDGIPVSAITANQSPRTSSGLDTNDSHFWATPVRLPDAQQSTDVFHVQFSTSERINSASFQIARFPHSAFLEYFDASTGDWLPCIQDNGLPANVFVSDSLPAVCWSAPIDSSHTHPQHFGTGHWLTYNFKLQPIQVSQLRLRLVRIDTGNGPHDPIGNVIPYSLGVKDFQVGYLVTSLNDVPIVGASDTNIRESQPISSSVDILGSPVDFVVRTNDASELVNGTGIWRCSPQPVPNAVVNLYADLRIGTGKAQVIDRIYLNPVYSGCTVNIYYSNDDAEQETFLANETPLVGDALQLLGTDSPTTSPTGIVFSGNASAVLDNTKIQFDQRKPFQMGLIFSPIFPSTDLNARTIYDDGNLSITWGPSITYPFGVTTGDPSDYGAFYINLGENQICVPSVFTTGSAIQWYITWSGEQLSVDVPTGQTLIERTAGTELANFNASTQISIGGALTETFDGGGKGDIVLRALILKVGTPDPYTTMQNFWFDPDDFVTTPALGVSHSTTNAILRFSPQQMSTPSNPFGFLGGPSVVFSALNWIPVIRSYQLKRGFYEFEPIHAKFINLEFSNLSAHPFETSNPVVVETQMFSNTISPLTGLSGPSNQGAAQGTDVHTGFAAWNRFADQVNLASNNAIPPYFGQPYLPTEVKLSNDPETASLLNQSSAYWNFQNHWQSINMAQFTNSGTHEYKNVLVPFEQRVAYFVGISNFQVFRSNMTTDEDTSQYVELFYDDLYLQYPDALNTWHFDDPTLKTGITTPDQMVKPVVIESAVFNSFRQIRGIQFATTQTPPAQLIPDPDFTDPSLQYWQPYGTAIISADANIAGTAKVVLDNNIFLWSTIQATYPTWNDIEISDPSPYMPRWEDLESTISAAQAGGIQTVNPITPSSVGRLFVATRVLTPTALAAPLTLDLINGDGTVLASKTQMPSGTMTEFFMEYRIGEGPSVGNTWDDVQAQGTWDQEEARGTWNGVSNRLDELVVENMTVALYQTGVVQNQIWYVDNLSLFDDAILWEFSRDGGSNWFPVFDIKNNANGVFIFPSTDNSVIGSGSKLMYRITGGAPKQNVSSLVIRPWYDSLLFGKRPTRLNIYGGPNLSPYDHFPDVSEDPRFKMWDGPIPQDWFYAFRQKLLAEAIKPTLLASGYASEGFAAGVNEGLPPDPSPQVLPATIVYGV